MSRPGADDLAGPGSLYWRSMGALISFACSAHDVLLAALSWTVWAAAAMLLLSSAARARVSAWAAELDGSAGRRADLAALTAAGAVTLWFLFQKAMQYRGFQLPLDSTIIVNTAANLLSGRGLACVVDGSPNVLSVHFAFFVPVFLSPVLICAKSPLSLLLIQSAAVSSTGLAAFLLTRRKTGSAFAGLVAMGLTYSHVSFHQLSAASLENSVFGPALFLWGLLLWDGGRRWGGGALWALALTTREQFPFTLAGLGLYHALTSSRPGRRRLAEGAAIVFGSAVLWYLEMRLVGSYADALNAHYWKLYSHFGASKEDVLRTVLTRPDRLLLHAAWPPARLLPLGLLLAGTAFLPLAGPAGLAALLAASAHHLLQRQYQFDLQNSAYTFGPLLFASACGLGALARQGRLRGRGRVWLAAAALTAGGWSLRGATRVLHAELGVPYVNAAPALADLVPDDASVWADEYIGCRLSARPQLKLLFEATLPSRFDVMLFRPEYVLIDKGTLLFLPPPDRTRIVGFLAREGYAKAGEAGSLVLLKDPQAPRTGPSPALTLPGEPADAPRVTPYLARIMDSEPGRRGLESYPPDLRYQPESAEQELRFAQVLAARELPALAVPHARRATSLRPRLAVGHSILAVSLAAAGDADGASAEYRAALAIQPDSVPTLANFGNHLLRSGKAQEALECFDRAVALDPALPALQADRGVVLLHLGLKDRARGAFETALMFDPGNAVARQNLPLTAGAPAPPPR